MRLLFLDIDGVLNSQAWFQTPRHKRKAEAAEAQPESEWGTSRDLYKLSHLDPEACARLQALVTDLDLQVVLSSTWRFNGVDLVAEWLRRRGFTHPLLGRTPRITSAEASDYAASEMQRGLEIEWWLLTNVPHNERQDLRLCVLDDDSDMGRLRPWHVKTAFVDGLGPEHPDKVGEVLSHPLRGLLDDPNPHWTPEALAVLYP